MSVEVGLLQPRAQDLVDDPVLKIVVSEVALVAAGLFNDQTEGLTEDLEIETVEVRGDDPVLPPPGSSAPSRPGGRSALMYNHPASVFPFTPRHLPRARR